MTEVLDAGVYWLKTAEGAGLERATIADYERHLRLHIVPRIGGMKLSRISAPTVRAFEDKLREDGLSAAMVRKVRTSLTMLLGDSLERGFVSRNVAKELRRGKERQAEKRAKGKLKVGVDIPIPHRTKSGASCLTCTAAGGLCC
jgi:integrase